MLVLTRKIGEVITLGDPRSPGAVIEVTVADVRGDSVRLSIAAPANIAVDRKEVWEDKRRVSAHVAAEKDGL